VAGTCRTYPNVDYQTTDYKSHFSMKSKNPVYRVKFSTRGRVTIPAPLRKKYGIKGGSRVALEVTPMGAFLLKVVVR